MTTNDSNNNDDMKRQKLAACSFASAIKPDYDFPPLLPQVAALWQQQLRSPKNCARKGLGLMALRVRAEG